VEVYAEKGMKDSRLAMPHAAARKKAALSRVPMWDSPGESCEAALGGQGDSD